MGWSFQIARINGISIKVHITFFLILILGAVQWGSITGTTEGALYGVVLMILLFTCVTLHELGHSLVAVHFGIPVREITLLPLGGVSLITRNPDKPRQEMLIAIAGPFVNVVIAVILFVALGGLGGVDLLNGRGLLGDMGKPSLTSMLLWLLAANVTLVAFNLIPAFPLDGGRFMRALLAIPLGYRRATRIASVVGQVIALGIGIFGLVDGNFILILIAVFVFFGAGQETATADSKTVLTTRRVGDAYNKNALTLTVGDRVSKAVDYLLTSHQPDFAVMQGSNLLGIVTRDDVLGALATSTTDLFATEIMERDVLKVDATKTLQDVSEGLSQNGKHVAAVYNNGTYLGLIGVEDIREAFTILAFLERQERKRQQLLTGNKKTD
ncbi:MAG: site-2 protease family protein [Chloroflexi bacterium]|nr:site-2 protease family protein [Chloroflexota bacterium]MCL5275209.1 site-2 protease family protein [Chloroflexota bacterium]